MRTPGRRPQGSRSRKQWFSASMCTAIDRRARACDLPNVVGSHDDEPALDELGSAGVHDGDRGRWRSIVSSTSSYQTVSPAR